MLDAFAELMLVNIYVSQLGIQDWCVLINKASLINYQKCNEKFVYRAWLDLCNLYTSLHLSLYRLPPFLPILDCFAMFGEVDG